MNYENEISTPGAAPERLHNKRVGRELAMQYLFQCAITGENFSLASWEAFLEQHGNAPIYFFSTKAEKTYWDCPMEPGAALVFGSEGKGLAEFYHKTYPEQFYTIPMPGNFHRSLNLANSVAVAVYEGLRRQR